MRIKQNIHKTKWCILKSKTTTTQRSCNYIFFLVDIQELVLMLESGTIRWMSICHLTEQTIRTWGEIKLHEWLSVMRVNAQNRVLTTEIKELKISIDTPKKKKNSAHFVCAWFQGKPVLIFGIPIFSLERTFTIRRFCSCKWINTKNAKTPYRNVCIHD